MPVRLSVLPPLPPMVHLRRAAPDLPFPFDQPGSEVFSTGRQAIFHGVGALGLGEGDEVLVSAYHHGSEVQALLEAGLTCRFFDPEPTLEPPGEEVLEALLSPRTRALVLTHHIGVPQDSRRWRKWCDAHGLLLIEDAAQSWLASTVDGPIGVLADLAVFCLYKTYGLVDGAVLVVRAGRRVDGVGGRRPLHARRLVRRHGRWLAARSALVAATADRVVRAEPYRLEDDFALGDSAATPARSTMPLLRRLVSDRTAERRRENYLAVAGPLGNHVPEGFRELVPGASPHSVPLHVPDRADFVSDIRVGGVRAFAFWSYPHPLLGDARRFPNAQDWRDRAVILPAHQELRPHDVDQIVEASARALARRR